MMRSISRFIHVLGTVRAEYSEGVRIISHTPPSGKVNNAKVMEETEASQAATVVPDHRLRGLQARRTSRENVACRVIGGKPRLARERRVSGNENCARLCYIAKRSSRLAP